MISFTAHNVILPDGSETLPGVTPLAQTGICQAALRTLHHYLPVGSTVVDLGCLEGGYAAAFARAGYDATGVEVRDDNMACCRYVEERLALPNLRFHQDDVRDWAATAAGTWDAVFCCGLLYHLDFPARFLAMLGEATGKLLILQTHYSAHPTATHEGYRGHWYGEGPGRWSSWGNPHSFWLAKDDLARAMWAAGFNMTYEQHDYHPPGLPYRDMFGGLEVDRGMFIGVKA